MFNPNNQPIQKRAYNTPKTGDIVDDIKSIIDNNLQLNSFRRHPEQCTVWSYALGNDEIMKLIKMNIYLEDSERLPGYQINPYIELFVGLREELLGGVEGAHRLLNQCHHNDEYVVKELNHFIDMLKMHGRDRKFKRSVFAYYRQPDENYGNTLQYVDGLFDRNRRLLLIRIDLEYGKDWDTSSLTEQEYIEKYYQAKRDRERLYKKICINPLFKNMLGYVWKMEFGHSTGFHYHMLFIFNGYEVRKDVRIGKMIGDLWNESITENRGRYFNCNAKKKEYQHSCLGNITNEDPGTRTGLESAINYMTKPDNCPFGKCDLPDNGRSFGKAELPTISTRGRPRSSQKVL